jgi:hypothetical protein
MRLCKTYWNRVSTERWYAGAMLICPCGDCDLTLSAVIRFKVWLDEERVDQHSNDYQHPEPYYVQKIPPSLVAWHKEKKGLIAQLGCDSIPSCNKMMPTVLACTTTDTAQGAQQFENKIVSDFFTNPSCKGITWAGHQGPTEAAKVSVAEAIQKPHWALSARLNLGNEKQYWQVLHHKTGTYAEGTDTRRKLSRSFARWFAGTKARL